MASVLSYDGTIQFTHIPHAAFKVEGIFKSIFQKLILRISASVLSNGAR